MKIKFIIPYPDVPYYCWQILVQINNFRKLGYEVDTHYICCYFNNNVSPMTKSFVESDKIKAHFHLYPDDRDIKNYPASMKPYMMYKYFQEFPEEKENIYVYLDADVIFLEPFDFTPFVNDDIWYGSDVGSYINSGYINQKGEGLLQEMCDFVGIDKKTVTDNDNNCIGAQYITKNNTADFWYDVYENSSKLYVHLQGRQSHYFKPEMIHWLQIWTMEMWLTLWELWRRGVKTKHTESWNFHWANHSKKDKKHIIYHNAGVTENDGKHFSKIHYQSSPFNKEILCSEDSLSYLYKLEVLDTQKHYPDLVWD